MDKQDVNDGFICTVFSAPHRGENVCAYLPKQCWVQEFHYNQCRPISPDRGSNLVLLQHMVVD